MRALVYEGPFKVAVKQVRRSEKIQHPNDIIVRITSACLCGSDLHTYEGQTTAQPGMILGMRTWALLRRWVRAS